MKHNCIIDFGKGGHGNIRHKTETYMWITETAGTVMIVYHQSTVLRRETVSLDSWLGFQLLPVPGFVIVYLTLMLSLRSGFQTDFLFH